jgi:hypothetical protein
MNILGIGIITNGLDVNRSIIYEVGAISVWIENGEFHYKDTYNSKVDSAEFKHDEDGFPAYGVFERLIDMMKPADFVISHGAKIDKPMFESYCDQLKLPYPKKKWIDSMKNGHCNVITHLALDYGLVVASGPTQAAHYVKLMLQIAERRKEWLIEEMSFMSTQPLKL